MLTSWEMATATKHASIPACAGGTCMYALGIGKCRAACCTLNGRPGWPGSVRSAVEGSGISEMNGIFEGTVGVPVALLPAPLPVASLRSHLPIG